MLVISEVKGYAAFLFWNRKGWFDFNMFDYFVFWLFHCYLLSIFTLSSFISLSMENPENESVGIFQVH